MFKHRDIRKMNRRELLELLVLQSKRIDELEEENDRVNKLLNNKEIMLNEAGSIAEASLKLNKIFEIAQEAANQYLENVKRVSKNNSN